MPNGTPFLGRAGWLNFAILAVILLVVFPTLLDPFRLNLVGKYLTYAFVAVGLVICWGYGGVLSASGRACSSASAAIAWRCT